MRKYDEKKLTIDELLFLYRYRDVDPFFELMSRYKPLVNKTLSKFYFIVGNDVEDLEQEANITLVKTLDTYNEDYGSTVGQYYKNNLNNHFTSLLRKQETDKRQIQKNAYSLDQFLEIYGDYSLDVKDKTQNTPEEDVIAGQLLDEFMEGLSLFETRVFYYFLEGRSIEEAANLLNCDKRKIMNARYRCYDKFRDIFFMNH